MAEVVKMPKMSDTMEEGVIAAWQKKKGDKVESGDVLAEVETDKATMDLESYYDGVILDIGPADGDTVPVNGYLMIVGEEGEDISDLLKEAKGGGGSSDKKSEKEDEEDADDEDGQDESEESEEESDGEETDDADEDISEINATLVKMPKMSDTMEEGVIASWQKKVGDKVESGDVLAEVETDKATMDLESYEDGVLLHIAVEEGDSVPVNGVVAVIGEEGADFEKLLKGASSKGKKKESDKKSDDKKPSKKEDSEEAPKEKKEQGHSHADRAATASPESGGSKGPEGRLLASPLAKKIAEDKGFDITKISGSGDSGRIVKRDVESYSPKKEQPASSQAQKSAQAPAQAVTTYQMPKTVGEESFTEQKVSQMRKTIAKRLAESKFTAPHFYLTMDINMGRAMEARTSLNELSPVKISFNDIVIKAVAAALRQHPKVNSSWLGDKVRYNEHIHIGMAVAVEEGLLVPVIRYADNKGLAHIAGETKELGGKAKNKQLQPEDWEGNTFTVSNLGMFGIDEFTAIINPPDACILAVGGIRETPIVKDGMIVPGNMMKVTMSCDHRVVDGAVGSAFLQTLKGLLEDPVRILI